MINHDGLEHAGYLAYLMMLAIFPFMLFLFALIGAIGRTDIGVDLSSSFMDYNLLSTELMDALKPRILEIISSPPQSLMTVAVLGAIWTSSSTVEALRTILNRAYRIKTDYIYIMRRMISILQFILITLLVLFTIFIMIFIPIIVEAVAKFFDSKLSFIILEMLNKYKIIGKVITFLILNFIIIIIYCVIPNKKMPIMYVIPGSLMVVTGWILSSYLFYFYLKNFQQINVVYGSIAGIIISMLLFYIFSVILIWGAEFNYSFNKFFIKNKNNDST